MPAELTTVTTDSRIVKPGMLYVAYKGSATDSHDFLPQVQAAGAAAAIVERAVDSPLPQILVRNGRRAAAQAAALQFGDPAEAVDLLAVTGTNGKTTSV